MLVCGFSFSVPHLHPCPQAKFMPYTGESVLVTAARDGQVSTSHPVSCVCHPHMYATHHVYAMMLVPLPAGCGVSRCDVWCCPPLAVWWLPREWHCIVTLHTRCLLCGGGGVERGVYEDIMQIYVQCCILLIPTVGIYMYIHVGIQLHTIAN